MSTDLITRDMFNSLYVLSAAAGQAAANIAHAANDPKKLKDVRHLVQELLGIAADISGVVNPEPKGLEVELLKEMHCLPGIRWLPKDNPVVQAVQVHQLGPVIAEHARANPGGRAEVRWEGSTL